MAAEEKRTRLFLHLKKWLEKAVMDYGMIAAGDRVLVGVSGGMDSMALLDLLNTPMVHVPPFSLTAVHIDPGFDPDGAGCAILARHLEAGGYDAVLEKTDIGHAIFQHSETRQAETKSESRINFGIDAGFPQDVRMDQSGSDDFEPTGVLANIAAFSTTY